MPIHQRSFLAEVPHRLRDLLAPRDCAGCRFAAAPGRPLCPGCRAGLAAAVPVAADPAVGAAVAIAAAGEYTGVLRQCLLAYKEHRRRDLAATLAAALARTLTVLGLAGLPLVLVPVPATRRALRQRGFDHVRLLGRRVSVLLPDAVVAGVLRCGPRPDSADLGLEQRIRIAAASLRARPSAVASLCRVITDRPTIRVILLDDIVTTGATLAAAATSLRNRGIEVGGAVAVAATSRRLPRKTGSSGGDIHALKR